MKVLVNASIYDGTKNGLGIYTEQILKALHRKNENLVFEIYSFKEIPETFPVKVISFSWLNRIICFGNLSIFRIVWNLIYLPFISRSYDLVYSVSPHGTWFISHQIITIHDLIGMDWRVSMNQACYYRMILPKLLRKVKAAITISDFTKNAVVNVFDIEPQKLFTFYNGVDHFDLSEYSVCPDESLQIRPFFLVVGASFPHKNVLRLLNVFKKVSEADLVIVGKKGSYHSNLKNVVDRDGMRNVKFMHKVSRNELGWLYQNAKANLYISLIEGFGFPPLEAIINNTISIVSKIDCFEEIYGNDTVIYVNPKSEEEIYQNILKILNCEINEVEMLQRGKLLIEKYRWNFLAENVIGLINRVNNQDNEREKDSDYMSNL